MGAVQSISVTAQPPYRCCGRSFSRKYELDRHLREAKAHASPLQCPFPGCQKAYGRPSRIRNHIRKDHRDQLVSLPRQNASSQRADVEATQAQLSVGSRFPSEHIEAGFQHNLMVDSSGTPSNTATDAYGNSHEEAQYLPHGQQGFSVSSESGVGMSAEVWLSSFMPDSLPNSSTFLEPMAAPLNSPFPASMTHPSSSYMHPPVYGSPAHSFAPSPANQDTIAVEEGTYPSYEFPNQNMGYAERSFSDPDAGNTNGPPHWDGW